MPARPAACAELGSGDALGAVASAAPGTAFCLAPGAYDGPVELGAGVTLWGPTEAVIRSSGAGTTVALDAPRSALLGTTVDGSGGRFDLLDAAVHVGADGARVEGVCVRNALFGVLSEQARGVRIAGVDVAGPPEKPLGMRGDAIRLWETRDADVVGNVVRDGRDLVVWYSPGNRFLGNRIERGRYGIHFMYSHGNQVVGNRMVGNVVGLFAMYSRELRIERNVLAASGGAAGIGVGAKESGSLTVRENWIVANTTGVYLDTSPLDSSDENLFERNLVRFGDSGIVFHGTVAGNRFLGNSLREHHVPVRLEGRGDALDALWLGNDFGDYRGYDLDGDGRGDLPYELRSLSASLVTRHPGLAFFRGTAALALVEWVGRAVPLLQPTRILVDPAPRMAALVLGAPPAVPAREAGS